MGVVVSIFLVKKSTFFVEGFSSVALYKKGLKGKVGTVGAVGTVRRMHAQQFRNRRFAWRDRVCARGAE